MGKAEGLNFNGRRSTFKGAVVRMCLSQQVPGLTIAQFQLVQLSGLAGVHSAVFGVPLVEAGITNAIPALD